MIEYLQKHNERLKTILQRLMWFIYTVLMIILSIFAYLATSLEEGWFWGVVALVTFFLMAIFPIAYFSRLPWLNRISVPFMARWLIILLILRVAAEIWNYRDIWLGVLAWLHDLIWNTGIALLSYLQNLGPVALILIIPVGLVIGIIYLTIISKQGNEQRLDRAYKVCAVTAWSLLGIFLGIGYFIASNEIVSNSKMAFSLLIFMASSFLLTGVLTWILVSYDPKVKSAKKILFWLRKHWLSESDSLTVRDLLSSDWRQPISRQENKEIISNLVSEILLIFPGSLIDEVLRFTIVFGTQKTFKEVLKVKKKLIQLDRELRMEVYQNMLAGQKFRPALRNVRSAWSERQQLEEVKSQKRIRFRESSRRVFQIIFYPLTKTWSFFSEMLMKTKILYKLFDLFNSRCPYFASEEKIKI